MNEQRLVKKMESCTRVTLTLDHPHVPWRVRLSYCTFGLGKDPSEGTSLAGRSGGLVEGLQLQLHLAPSSSVSFMISRVRQE